jgi:hypothetical protein
MTQHILTVMVTDTNNRSRGIMPVSMEFDVGGPTRLQHNGQTYRSTGKLGRNQATGLSVREMATIDDARLWITLDGAQIWED